MLERAAARAGHGPDLRLGSAIRHGPRRDRRQKLAPIGGRIDAQCLQLVVGQRRQIAQASAGQHLRMAIEADPRLGDVIPSTKGSL